MFYYPNVLQRHTGCFSTIWLAATKGIRISRREYLKVNIGRTWLEKSVSHSKYHHIKDDNECEDIVDYVMVQVPPVHPSLPRPRFSLYLSSQLQYGIVIVYHRQCAFLLEEVQQTIERLLRSKRHLNIDMPDTDRLVLNVPDSLFQLEEAEWALEPFFGVMGVDCEPPSPYLPSQQCIEGSSPLVARKEITSPKGLIASSESITIKDAEPVPVLAAEFGGAELPEATAQEIDLLMEQQDQFHLGDEEDKERERATEAEKSGDLDAAMVSIEQLKNSECIVDEGNGRPTEVILDRVAMEMTPPPITMPPTTEASERDVEMERSSEVVRESGAAALVLSELSANSDVPLDVSKGDKSQNDLITPTSRWSPIEEAPVSMEVILEEHVDLPQGQKEPEMDDITTADLLRLINGFIKRFGKVCFHSLLPPEAECSTAAHLFYKILELLCSLKLSAYQNEAFGVITITMNR
ncbi:meiotic recombination REC8-like protein [Labeo rohita]|uniref:Meiotic recombination REC8-like protein n=1 Tax=Labeo rohita TaxID=84645 RepID=A0A498MQI6_LABRO|nr:meiotic recombination REC8-like protein [Labeo rohita]RXN28236.1 meiotic recombination REC8-like protein [Labeo rohita]